MGDNGKLFPIKEGEHEKIAKFINQYVVQRMKSRIPGSFTAHFDDQGNLVYAEKFERHR